MALGGLAAAGFSFAGGLYGETFIILTPTPQPGRPGGTLRRALMMPAAQMSASPARSQHYSAHPCDAAKS